MVSNRIWLAAPVEAAVAVKILSDAAASPTKSLDPAKKRDPPRLEAIPSLSCSVSTALKMAVTEQDTQVSTLRNIVTSESEPLARRFRALFSLKHLAGLQPPSAQTVPAIEAIAAAFSSPSALLKHELAYCLGQSGHDAAIAPLRGVLEDKEEDSMCRHEAAEALGALSDKGSLDLLRALRDDANEVDVVRETCDIAVERIEWDHGLQKGQEKLKKRCVCIECVLHAHANERLATSRPSIPRRHYHRALRSRRYLNLKRHCSTRPCHCSSATEPCSPCATFPRRQIFQPLSQLCRHLPVASATHRLSSATKSPLFLDSSRTLHPSPVLQRH